uniref:NADH-ubiquinone oxidoreductase chain 2 n=1 Tax=Conwentzia sinica TaxID=450904 RepID=A0A7U1G3H2_9NEOP|nr:NADH dehydrogenase subunit 2 [Conwentzia sinica]QQY84948.1 NADH dehydrogenase subunit 2 [Conwentzia sinica]
MKLYNYLFLAMMMFGTMIVLSSNSWFSIWMGLEINLLAFIPLINKNFNLLSTEASLKYFLVQALASSILLLGMIFFMCNSNMNTNLIYNLALLLKMGSAPFHFWLPSVSEGLDWFNLFILLSWQKIAPFVTIFINLNYYLIVLSIVLTSLMGAIGGLNQTSLRKIMAYSSVNHLGWMLFAIMNSKMMWIFYIVIYTMILGLMSTTFYLINSFYLNQLMFSFKNVLIKFFIFTNFLSLGGLPPFLGFLPKWMVLENYLMGSPILMVFMVMMTIISLNYYLRMMFFSFTINNMNLNLISKFNYNYFLFFSMFNLMVGFLILFFIFMLF